jgi:hypothetical protein
LARKTSAYDVVTRYIGRIDASNVAEWLFSKIKGIGFLGVRIDV